MIAQKTIFDKDIYTYTLYGQRYINHAWLTDIIFYLLFSAFGPPGIVLLRTAIVLTIFTLLLLISLNIGSDLAWSAMFLVPVILISQGRFIERPHLMSYFFFSIFLYILFTTNKGQRKRLLILPALMVVWCNSHAGFIMGVFLVGAFFAEKALKSLLSMVFDTIQYTREDKEALQQYGIIFGLTLLAAFINPHPIAIFEMLTESEQKRLLMKNTTEWFSPFNPFFKGSDFFYYYKIWIAVVIGSFILNVKRIRFSHLVIATLTLAQSLSVHRFRVEFSLGTFPIVIYNLKGIKDYIMNPFLSRLSVSKARAVFVASTVLAVFLTAQMIYSNKERIKIGFGIEDRYPGAAMDFMDKHNIDGITFNSICFGGYILWRAYPERRVYIDGRNFDAPLYRDYLDCQFEWNKMVEIIEKYNVDNILLRYPLQKETGNENHHRMIMDSRQWGLVYFDDDALLYLRAIPKYRELLERFRYRYYHPIFYDPNSRSLEHVQKVIEELLATLDRYPGLDNTLQEIINTPKTEKERLQSLKRKLNKYPKMSKLFNHLGRSYMRLGQPQRAMNAFRKALIWEYDNPALYNLLGMVQTRVGDHKGALNNFMEAYRLAPQAGLAFNVALTYQALGEYDKAIKYIYEVLEDQPNMDNAYITLITLLEQKGLKQQANDYIKLAARKFPTNPLFHFMLGNLYRESGDNIQASLEYKKAIELDKDYYQAWGNLASIYLDQGELELAFRAFQEVLRINPNEQTAKRHVEMLSKKLGQ